MGQYAPMAPLSAQWKHCGDDVPFAAAVVLSLAFVAVSVALGLPRPFAGALAEALAVAFAGAFAAAFVVAAAFVTGLVTFAFVFASGLVSSIAAWRDETRVGAPADFLGAISVVVSCSLGVFLIYLTPATVRVVSARA